MPWSIFIDLAEGLTDDQRSALFAALEAIVPDGGCIGPDRGGVEVLYFVVDAPSPEAARTAATAIMENILATAAMRLAYTVTAQASH